MKNMPDQEKIIGEEESFENEIEKEIETESMLHELKEEIDELKSKSNEPKLKFTDSRLYGPQTSIQHNGSSYMTTIPIEIVKQTNLDKGDSLRWRVADYGGVKMITAVLIEEKELKLPPEERKHDK